MIVGGRRYAGFLAIESGKPVPGYFSCLPCRRNSRSHGALLRTSELRVRPMPIRRICPASCWTTKTRPPRGLWSASRGVGPYVGYEYLHEKAPNNPASRVRYTPDLPEDGWYEVRMSYSNDGNRVRMKVVIQTAAGREIQFIDQTRKQGELSPFISLGTFAFKKGKEGYLEIQGSADAGRLYRGGCGPVDSGETGHAQVIHYKGAGHRKDSHRRILRMHESIVNCVARINRYLADSTCHIYYNSWMGLWDSAACVPSDFSTPWDMPPH